MHGIVAMDIGWRGPSADESYRVCGVYCDGNVSRYDYCNTRYGVAPVVSIPKSNIVNIKTALGI